MSDEINRRKHARISVKVLVNCQEVGGWDRGSVLSFFTNDISMGGGIFLQSPQIFLISTKLNIVIKLIHPEIIVKAKGIVARYIDLPDSDLRGMGIKLEIPDQTEKMYFERFIAHETAKNS